MKLYKIIVEHHAPRGSHKSIQEYVIANDDLHVATYIDKEHNCDKWKENDDNIEDNHGDEINLFNWVISKKGDFNYDYDNDGIYEYGLALFGWEEVSNFNEQDFEPLIRLGIAKRI